MKFGLTVLLLTSLISHSVNANDLGLDDLNMMLGKDIANAEKRASDKVNESRETNSNTANAEYSAVKPQSVPQAKGAQHKEETKPKDNGRGRSRLARPDRDVDPEAYDAYIRTLAEILTQLDNPEKVLNAKVSLGEMVLSPNDIYAARAIDQVIEEAENSNLVDTEVLNLPYSIDAVDRYKTYDIYISDTGTTQIEFFDAMGNPWPIYYNSDAPNFNVLKQSINTLWVTSKMRYKKSNLFVTLDQYPATIQFNLIYSSTQRHGIATFNLPFISPVSNQVVSNPTSAGGNLDTTSNDNKGNGYQVDLNGSQSSGPNSNFSKVALTVANVPQSELSYLANTGFFNSGSEASKKAKSIKVSDNKVAQIWFYKDKFIVRTPYQLLERYESVVNSGGAMKVFVAKNLNSIIYFEGNQSELELIIPDYHRYRKGWN